MKVLLISLNKPVYNSAREIQFAKVVDAIKSAGIITYGIVGDTTKRYTDQYNSDQTIYLSNNNIDSFQGIAKVKNRIKAKYYKYFPYRNKSVNNYLKKALSIIKVHQPDCIITSSNPLESHLVGLSLKVLTNLPWVAFFSDPRPNSILPPPYRNNADYFQSIFEKYWIAKVLRRCDVIHMPSKYGIILTEKAFGIPISDKSYAIPHIGSIPKENTSLKYKGWMVHTGRLVKSRVSTHFLLAIREANKQIPNRFSGLLCVGVVCPEFIAKVNELNMGKIVKIIDQRPHLEAIKIIQSASSVVVLEADMKVSPFFPSKFAEYASTNTPILAVTPPISAIRDYINKFGCGIAVSHDKEEIIDGICRIFPIEIERNKIDNSLLSNEFKSSTVGEKYKSMILNVLRKNEKC